MSNRVPAVDAITRREGDRWISVSSDVADGFNANRKIREVQNWLAQQEIPPEVRVSVAGQLEDQRESQQFLLYAFGFALLLMFAVLLLEFNNFFAVFVVLLAVILSFAGVMLGMLVMNQTFSVIMTGIGVVALAGIVVNNNIILVDTYQSLRRRMHDLDAISGAVARRIRPVLLTTVTTMAGLCPMMFAVSIDFIRRDVEQGNPSALWWSQLATAIVFGLGVLHDPDAYRYPFRTGRALLDRAWRTASATSGRIPDRESPPVTGASITPAHVDCVEPDKR